MQVLIFLYIFRCVLDTMRLVDLLLVLLFEGRKALPKSGISNTASRIPGLRRMDSAGERSHRQLIDCIRSKDTDALIDAVDTGKCQALSYLAISISYVLKTLGTQYYLGSPWSKRQTIC